MGANKKKRKNKPQKKFLQMSEKKVSELKQIFSEFRRNNRMDNEMEIAPLRSLDDFIMTKSRFQVPDFRNEDRWFNRIVFNLMYYQTNYLLSSFIIFLFVFLSRPQEMTMGIFLMALVFGGVLVLQTKKVEVRNFKQNHPLVVTSMCFLFGYYLIYKLTSGTVFILGVLVPIVFIIVDSSLRMRNVMNKITNVSNVLGFTKQTPMGIILESIGIEPNFKYQYLDFIFS